MERKKSTLIEVLKDSYAHLKNPWFWAITAPAIVITTFVVRYKIQAEEINRKYNEMHGRTNAGFNYYNFKDEEIYKMLDYLDEKGVKVGDDMVRLSRRIDDLLDKSSFY